MCSNLENIDLPPQKVKISLEKLQKCKRCERKSFVCLQKKDVFCSQCFYEYCSHKFRATIGKSRLVKPKDPVLIAFSGGSSSVAMLDIIKDALENPDIHRKLLFSPSLLFVREISYQNEGEESLQMKERKVLEILSRSGMKCFISSLEMFYSPGESRYIAIDEKYTIPSCPIGKEKLKSKLDQIGSLTAKEDFIRIIRQQLIQEVATKEEYAFIFSGETCTRTAILTLSDIAQGKGSQIIFQQAFCDNRFNVRILRPMREFVKKEVAFWNLMRGNSPVEWTSLTTKKNAIASMSKLTESYVNGLEKDFPATVYTIFRTGNKLQQPEEEGEKCLFCKSKKDDFAFCSAFNALRLSNRLSKNMDLNAGQENGEASGSQNPFCYSCSTLFSEMDTGSKRVKRNLTEADIAEYLL